MPPLPRPVRSSVPALQAEAANYPFCTIEPNVGLVTVPDTRLAKLAEMSASAKVVAATVEFVDIAGLVKGASKGEGLGNKFLSHIREVDMVVQMVRCFEDDDVVHVDGRVDPVADVDTINVELALRDIEQIEQRLVKLQKKARIAADQVRNDTEAAALQKLLPFLEEGKPARSVELKEEEEEVVAQLCLLTMKPVIFAANVSEDDLADKGASNDNVKALREYAEADGSPVVVVSAAVEAELADLEADERGEYLAALGVEEGGLGSLVRATYGKLGLRTYYTTGETESRAWTIPVGATAPQAAGVIHGDFERGFIAAETIAYDDYVELGGRAGAREAGKLRAEGKEYVVEESDVLEFRYGAFARSAGDSPARLWPHDLTPTALSPPETRRFNV